MVAAGVELDVGRLYSPGTVAVALFEATGATPPLAKFRGRPDDLGRATSAFYGGLTDVRHIRRPLPLVCVDAPSQYARMASAIGVCRHLAADTIVVRRAGVADRVRRLLAGADLEQRTQRPEFWRRWGFTFVGIRPRAGDRLVAKARYNPGADEWILAANPIDVDATLWFSLFDAATTTLDGGRPPEIVDGIAFVARGIQAGLQPVAIRGGRPVDLGRGGDLYVALDGARDRIRADRRLSDGERDRLSATVKLVTEAAACGQFARFDPPIGATAGVVYGPWGPQATSVPVERPGPWCWPPAAAAVCAAARLQLTLAEIAAGRLGFDVVAVDTDGLALTPTAGR